MLCDNCKKNEATIHIKEVHDGKVVASNLCADCAREKEESIQDTEAVEEESLSLEEKEREMIARALEKNHGKRKLAAQDLGISERTLYRKLKEYNLDK